MAMAPRSNRDELNGLGGSTPLLLFISAPLADRLGPSLPNWSGGFNSRMVLSFYCGIV